MIEPISDKALKKWYEETKKKVYATGWRRHGAKIGDTVILHCEDDYYQFDDDKPNLCIRTGSSGIITQLEESPDGVIAKFEYQNEIGDNATVEIDLNIGEDDYAWLELLEIPKSIQREQLVLEF